MYPHVHPRSKDVKYLPPRNLTDTELIAIFKKHDINNDGKLDRGELKAAFKEMGSLIPPWRAYRGLRHADHNGNGLIDDEHEWTALMLYALKQGYTVK